MMNMVLFPFVGLGRYSFQVFRVQYFEITSINKRESEVIANVDKAFEVKSFFNRRLKSAVNQPPHSLNTFRTILHVNYYPQPGP